MDLNPPNKPWLDHGMPFFSRGRPPSDAGEPAGLWVNLDPRTTLTPKNLPA